MEKRNAASNNKSRKLRRTALGALGATGLLLLSGCTSRNFSGEGNEFVVDGKVRHGGDQSITIDVYSILKEEGDAKGWFEDGDKHQVHDNCKCGGGWDTEKTYGKVYNAENVEIEPSELREGQCVELTGSIHDTHGKYNDPRPVYDTAEVIPC